MTDDLAFYKDETLAVVIDGASLYNSAKILDLEIDFRRLRELFLSKSRLLRISYHAIVYESEGHNGLVTLLDWIDYNGYVVNTRYVREVEGRPRNESIAVALSIKAIELAKSADHIVLMLGNGDYLPLLKHLQSIGRRVTVISSLTPKPSVVSDALRRQADQFIDLIRIAPEICREERRLRDEGRIVASTPPGQIAEITSVTITANPAGRTTVTANAPNPVAEAQPAAKPVMAQPVAKPAMAPPARKPAPPPITETRRKRVLRSLSDLQGGD